MPDLRPKLTADQWAWISRQTTRILGHLHNLDDWVGVQWIRSLPEQQRDDILGHWEER